VKAQIKNNDYSSNAYRLLWGATPSILNRCKIHNTSERHDAKHKERIIHFTVSHLLPTAIINVVNMGE